MFGCQQNLINPDKEIKAILEFPLAVNNSLMTKQVEKGSKDDSNDH
jgi:hypothetical protein